MSAATNIPLLTARRIGMFWLGLAAFASAADVQSTWDGSTNVWHSTSNWSHSAPSLLGYPSNGIQTYDVRIDAGDVTLNQTGNIDGLELRGGHLVLDAPLILQSNFVWTDGDIDGGLIFNWPEIGERLEVRGGIRITGGAPRRLMTGLRTHGSSLLEGPLTVLHGSWEYWQNFGPLELRGACLFSNAFGGQSVLQSYGPITKTGPGDVLFDDHSHFDSYGGLEIQEGTLRLNYDGSFGGNVQVNAGATLAINHKWYARSNSVIGGGGLIKIGEPGVSSLRGHFGANPGFVSTGSVFLSNVRVEIHSGALGDYGNGALIGPDSIVSLLNTNGGFLSSASGIDGTNLGTVFIKGTPVWLEVRNENLIEIQADGQLEGSVHNRGSIVKSGGIGRTRTDGFGLRLLNEGVMETRVGTLGPIYQGTNFGTFLAAAGATNEFAGAPPYANSFTFAAGTRFLGAGQHDIGYVVMRGAITNESNVRIRRTVGDSTFFNTSDGTLFVGQMEGTVLNEGTAIAASWNGYAYTGLSNLQNEGTFEWRDGSVSGIIHNDGEILKTSPSNFVVEAGTVLSNRGVIRIQEGSLTFSNTFTNTASLIIASNATVVVASSLVLEAGTQLEGVGRIVVTNGGNLIVATPLTNPIPTIIDGGTLTALSDYTVEGRLGINDGVLTGPGDVFVASNAVASLSRGTNSGPGAWLVREGGALCFTWAAAWERALLRNIENDGTLTLDGGINARSFIVNRGFVQSRGLLHGYASTLSAFVVNEGHWLVESNQSFILDANTALWTNRGLIEVQGQLGSGGLVQESGEFRLVGGYIDSVQLHGGALTGTGTNTGSIISLGRISPGGTFGRMTLNELRLGSGSTVEFDIGGTDAGSFDRIDVGWDLWCSNNVTFVVRLANGFMPQLNDTFEVMTYRWRVETQFTPVRYPNFRGLTLPNGLRLAPVLGGQSLKFIVTAAPTAGQKPLHLSRADFGLLKLQWPPEYAGFILQSATNLPSSWINVRFTDVTNSGFWGGQEQMYFRLVDPEIHE